MKTIQTLAICATIFFVGFVGFGNSNMKADPPAVEHQKWEYLQVREQYGTGGTSTRKISAFDTKLDKWTVLLKDKYLTQAMDIIGRNGWELVGPAGDENFSIGNERGTFTTLYFKRPLK